MDDSTPASAVQPPSKPCRRCQSPGPHTIGPGAGPHKARLLCGACGSFIDWLSVRTPEEQRARKESARQEAMRKQPTTRLQREYLAKLGYAGPVPTNKLEASDAIKAMLRQREGNG